MIDVRRNKREARRLHHVNGGSRGWSHLKTLSAFVAFFFLCLASPAFAAKRVALVIGNDVYAEIEPLKKAVNDAKAVGDALEEIGFTVMRGENLTRRETNTLFASFANTIGPGDTAFFFYAGHGVAIGERNLLLPVDVPAADDETLIEDEAQAVDLLLERVAAKGAAVSVFVLDSCRNNPFSAKVGRSVGGSRGLQRVAPPRGSLVLMSAGTGQAALDRLSDADGDPNSVFTRKFVPLLKTPGLTHIQIAKRVQEQVEDVAKTINMTQTPAFYDQIRGEVVFVPGNAPTPQPEPEPAPDAVAALPAPDPGTPSQPAAPEDPCRDAGMHWAEVKSRENIKLFRSHLDRFGACAFAELAQIELDRLQEESFSRVRQVLDAAAELEAAAVADPAPADGRVKLRPLEELLAAARRNELALSKPNYDGEICADGSATDASAGGSVCVTSALEHSQNIYSARSLADGDAQTAWIEGVSGQGLGETIIIDLGRAMPVDRIELINGYGKNRDIFSKNSRVKTVTMGSSAGTEFTAELHDDMGWQTIRLPSPAEVTWLSIRIDAVYPGWKYEDTAISELRVQ